jgi:exodeoxyribonuclease VII large subunit
MEFEQVFTVSQAVGAINQTLDYAYPQIIVEGEVANFKISGGKWVFFDLKDDEMSLKCFMTAWGLRVGLEDGMKIAVNSRPRLTKYGFSLNVDAIKLVGEGEIRKSFDLLQKKLAAEGLFDLDRKRPLPALPEKIAVISSTDAAGYKDFIKIISQRFGGLAISVANVAVQGECSADQMIRALQYFNESSDLPEVICLLRGGGSRDDLVAFDDERLVREIARSKVPVLTGVGHEIDTTLADLAADARASTPSNAAEILVPDKREVVSQMRNSLQFALQHTESSLGRQIEKVEENRQKALDRLSRALERAEHDFAALVATLRQLDPKLILQRGYAVVRGEAKVGAKLEIETAQHQIAATVDSVAKV